MRTVISLLFSLFWLLLAVFVVIFAASNPAPVAITFWPFDTQLAMAPWVLLMGGMGLGLLLALVVSSWLRLKGFVRARRTERENRRLARANQSLSDEAGQLRSDKSISDVARHSARIEGGS